MNQSQVNQVCCSYMSYLFLGKMDIVMDIDIVGHFNVIWYYMLKS